MKSPDTQSNDGRDVSGVIARLLLHYYAPGDLSDGARRAMAQDWVEDLVEFGPHCVSEACRTWRRVQSKRPTPADIRRLCIEAEQEQREHAQVRAIASPDGLDGYARSIGFASEAERVATIRRDDRRKAEQYERARVVREDIAANVGALRTTASASAKALRDNGVTACEITPERYRADQVALGIEPAETPPSAAGAG